MKKLLIPINLTDNSANAIRYGTTLANELKAHQITFLTSNNDSR